MTRRTCCCRLQDCAAFSQARGSTECSTQGQLLKWIGRSAHINYVAGLPGAAPLDNRRFVAACSAALHGAHAASGPPPLRMKVPCSALGRRSNRLFQQFQHPLQPWRPDLPRSSLGLQGFHFSKTQCLPNPRRNEGLLSANNPPDRPCCSCASSSNSSGRRCGGRSSCRRDRGKRRRGGSPDGAGCSHGRPAGTAGQLERDCDHQRQPVRLGQPCPALRNKLRLRLRFCCPMRPSKWRHHQRVSHGTGVLCSACWSAQSA